MNGNLSLNSDVISELKNRYLLFNIGDTKYGISLEYVLEIINIQSITSIPGVADYIKGIINLRGKIIPIIDTRIKLLLPERRYDEKTCIIVLNVHDMQVGMIVDSVSEVASVDSSRLSAPTDVGDASSNYLSTIMDFGDEIVLNLDCEKIFKTEL